MRKLYFFFCTMFAMFSPAIVVQAQTTDSLNASIYDMSLEELLNTQVSVASTEATNIFNTPSTVSIIDRKTLENFNFGSIGEALQTIAGIGVVRTTSRQELVTSRWILQDHYPNKTLILINGVPNWNPVTGEAGSLNRISVTDVERIEILKGPASVQYGTNAYTGAVNIVLKTRAQIMLRKLVLREATKWPTVEDRMLITKKMMFRSLHRATSIKKMAMCEALPIKIRLRESITIL